MDYDYENENFDFQTGLTQEELDVLESEMLKGLAACKGTWDGMVRSLSWWLKELFGRWSMPQQALDYVRRWVRDYPFPQFPVAEEQEDYFQTEYPITEEQKEECREFWLTHSQDTGIALTASVMGMLSGGKSVFEVKFKDHGSTNEAIYKTWCIYFPRDEFPRDVSVDCRTMNVHFDHEVVDRDGNISHRETFVLIVFPYCPYTEQESERIYESIRGRRVLLAGKLVKTMSHDILFGTSPINAFVFLVYNNGIMVFEDNEGV